LFDDEMFGDDAGDLSAAAEHGVGEDTHQADFAAAVNEDHAALRDFLSQFARGVAIDGLRADAGAAQDTQCFQLSVFSFAVTMFDTASRTACCTSCSVCLRASHSSRRMLMHTASTYLPLVQP